MQAVFECTKCKKSFLGIVESESQKYTICPTCGKIVHAVVTEDDSLQEAAYPAVTGIEFGEDNDIIFYISGTT